MRRETIARYLYSFFLLSAVFLNSFSAGAETVSRPGKNGLNIDAVSVAELQKLYTESGYDEYIPLETHKVPAIFLKNFPEDYDRIKDDNLRNGLFIRILSPLALKVNEAILAERAQLEKIITDFDKNAELSPAQTQWVEQAAKKYDVFTRLKGYRRYKLLLGELRYRIDALPPSVLIAVSAIETNWGQSRIVKEGRSLYKELVWYSDEGLKPEGETEDPNYRIKIFPSLYDSMYSFALKINSNVNFEDFRSFRKEQRYRRQLLDGRSTAYTFFLLSPLPNYIGLLDYTITFYELVTIDASELNYNFQKQPRKNNDSPEES